MDGEKILVVSSLLPLEGIQTYSTIDSKLSAFKRVFHVKRSFLNKQKRSWKELKMVVQVGRASASAAKV